MSWFNLTNWYKFVKYLFKLVITNQWVASYAAYNGPILRFYFGHIVSYSNIKNQIQGKFEASQRILYPGGII